MHMIIKNIYGKKEVQNNIYFIIWQTNQYQNFFTNKIEIKFNAF